MEPEGSLPHQKSPPPALILARSIQSTVSYFTSWRSILILSSRLRLGLPSGLLPSGFPTTTLHAPLLSPIRAIFPTQLILDLFTQIIFGEEYRVLISLCSFLHSPVTSSLLVPNIIFTTLFSNNLNLLSSLSVRDQVLCNLNLYIFT